MSVLKSKYDPKLCCAHEWAKPRDAFYGAHELCVKCGAYCTRDADKRIVSYAAHGLRDVS